MRKGYWVVRTWTAGPVGEKTKYFIPGDRPSKSERRIKSEIKKQEDNEASAVKRLARLLNANAQPGDKEIGLHYDEAHLDQLAQGLDKNSDSYMEELYFRAHHELKLWLRRLRRHCEKKGVELKIMAAITSDMDGKTGESVRLHHHVVINAAAAELCLQLWTAGSTHQGKLWRQADRTALAQYLLQQVRRIKPNQQKYISSRNLIRPQPKDRIAKSSAEIRLPRGARLLHRSEYKPGAPQYIRYITREALEAVPELADHLIE